MKKFKASYPYPLEYPIKAVVTKLGRSGLVAWIYQKFVAPVLSEFLVVNERILELPQTHEWLGQIFGSRPKEEINILEIGHVASQLSLELASLGYKTTAIDLRNYPFSHPNLTSVKGDFLTHNFKEKFDAIISLSVIEHFGFSQRYGGEDEPDNNYDEQCFDKIAKTLAEGGRAIISVPYARATSGGVWYRVYTRDNLEQKLEKYFIVEEKRYYVRQNNEWNEAAKAGDPALPYDGVALFLLKKGDKMSTE